MVSSSERTVIWNSLCTISNLCDDVNNLPVLAKKDILKQCMLHYLVQKEDVKLQSRVMRILYKLSRDDKSHAILEESFRVTKIVEVINQTTLDDMKLDAIRYVVNLAHNKDFCEKLLEGKAVEMMVKVSLCQSDPLLLEITRGFLALSQISSPQLRSSMIKAGAVQRLIALKKTSQNE
ncbi:hypothetical protein AKO1_001878, partial [Acrasis kona]